MTRKHFIHLAHVLKNMKPAECNCFSGDYIGSLNKWEETCREMADFCSTYNSSFDRYKFMTACGVDE